MSLLDTILPTLENFGSLTYWFALLAALAESLAFLGALFPGSILVILGGFAAAQGFIKAIDLFWFVLAGVLMGDTISYFLGTKGVKLFKNENKLLRISHLDSGKEFFMKHGSKSLFLGRFIGPLRAIIPFIAGLTKMDLKIFYLWNFLSAVLWSALHVSIGYFFGSAINRFQIWSTRVGIFLSILTTLTVLTWFVVKNRKYISDLIKTISNSVKSYLLNNSNIKKLINRYPNLFNFLRTRMDKSVFIGLPITILAILFGILLFTFLGVTEDVLSSDPLVLIDNKIANLLFDYRNQKLIIFFLGVSSLGKVLTVALISSAAGLILFIKKKTNYILPLFLTLIGTEITVYLLKLLINRPRPPEDIAYYLEKSLSFPSGHSAIAVASFGFLTYIFLRHMSTWTQKTNILFIGTLIILGIGLSRMYLGVHYLSDVLGGFLIGGLWLIIGITLREYFVGRKFGD